jgi:hypothetical protein
MKRTLGWVFAALVVLAIALALGRAYTARNAPAPALAASPVAGQIADQAATLNPVFYVPLAGYLLLAGFALAASRARVRNAASGGVAGGH